MLPWQVLEIAKSKLQPDDPLLMVRDKLLIDNPNSETCLSAMKVVVGLCAVLPFTDWPLLTGPWLLNLNTLTALTAGDQTEMDRSFPSCTIEHVHQQRQNGCFQDGIQRSNRV